MKTKYIVLVILKTVSSQGKTANIGTVVIEPNTVFSTHANFINTAQGFIINDEEAYIFKKF